MARGKPVRVGGTVRTIPAAKVARFEAINAQLDDLFPDDRGRDRSHERAAARQAAALYLLGDLDTYDAGDALADARRALDAAAAAARVVVMLANEDRGPGHEAPLSREVRVDRLTVRKWIGKQDRG